MPLEFKDITIFDDKTFDVLLKDIYTNSKTKSTELSAIIGKIIEIVANNPSQATNLLPLVAEYSDISIKNDDTLVKLANIIQRFYSKSLNNSDTPDDSNWNLPQHEIDALLNSTKELQEAQYIDITPTKLEE